VIDRGAKLDFRFVCVVVLVWSQPQLHAGCRHLSVHGLYPLGAWAPLTNYNLNVLNEQPTRTNMKGLEFSGNFNISFVCPILLYTPSNTKLRILRFKILAEK
jgi:hypothetical protein